MPDPEIRGLTSDSRAVRPGYLFAALPGTRIDGRQFIADAVARGAVAVLVPARPTPAPAPPDATADIRVIADANPRRRLAQIAARFFARQPATVVAVTGTNGKTSVAEFTRQLWAARGMPGASLGTLGLTTGSGQAQAGLTTPDPIALHLQLRQLADAEIGHLAIEASSHGLDQCRLDGVRFRAAAFTNLSHDHLDYHGSMQAYLEAKLRLFSELLPGHGTAVLNRSAPQFAEIAAICRCRGITVLSYGTSADCDLTILRSTSAPGGQQLLLRVQGRVHTLFLGLVGRFQAMNVLAALGLVGATEGWDDHAAGLEACRALKPVPGRLEQVATHPSGATIYVDFAHTPAALHSTLLALRPHVTGRLVCIFGAGGDRDRKKRAPMGRTVAALADCAIVTDDNPRSEPPAAIRQAILAGCPDAREIGDREAAIAEGLRCLQHDDALIVAGKGHEQGQIVGDRVTPFDDAVVVRRQVAALAGAGA